VSFVLAGRGWGYAAMIYAEALQELLGIVSRPGVPQGMARSAARLSLRIDLCLVAARAAAAAHGVTLEPSAGFLEYLSAARVGDWRLAEAVERKMLAAQATPERHASKPRMPEHGTAHLELR